MYSSTVQEKVAHWTQVISDVLVQNHIRLPDSAELFVELDDATDSCLYYFVDHAAQTEFWIEELPTDFLDLPAVVSDSHLRASHHRSSDVALSYQPPSGLALEELYWNHVEHFPSHRFEQLSLRVDELTHVFVHARAGAHMSAPVLDASISDSIRDQTTCHLNFPRSPMELKSAPTSFP